MPLEPLALHRPVTPERYAEARAALARCAKIDEVKEWQNRAAALAAYARQARDKHLLVMAVRIKLRAMRRMGELLREYPADDGDRPGRPGRWDRRGRRARISTRAAIAQQTGISADEQKDALRIASLAAAAFEEAVEAVHPPSPRRLLEDMRRPLPPPDLDGRDPDAFQASTYGQGRLEAFAAFTTETPAAIVAAGALAYEYARIREHAATVTAWLAALAAALPEEQP